MVSPPLVDEVIRPSCARPRLVANRGLSLKSAPDGPLRICETSRDQRWPYAEFCSNNELSPACPSKATEFRLSPSEAVHRCYIKIANACVVSGVKEPGPFSRARNAEKGPAPESERRRLDPVRSKSDRAHRHELPR